MLGEFKIYLTFTLYCVYVIVDMIANDHHSPSENELTSFPALAR